ncbi:putative Rho/RAC guanine nucleotide exchange factor [Histomonas meleagridis]|uniref:putative Rho/RAC guanine nucleotide exchange factor n=1 Tax=Histomonas meleagridis TaxID=135588 RepID=UPI003559C0FE|nr:putative Rho/RAC guanine nucleotide exchange factor [Histomonas meleagridis]KAH0805434.1 putative Rho/RAC guanine nucleotide exchange factor [Histomonas meleagridis]
MSQEKAEKQRQNVIEEIIKTEEKYNGNLHEISEVVCIPLDKLFKEGRMSIPTGIPTLFEKLSKVQNASDSLMQKLVEFKESTDPNRSIGHCFDDFAESIDIYFEYIREFHICNSLLIEERKRKGAFDHFLLDCETRLRDTVEAYLIMPVQRPPRYRLLLQALLKTTPEGTDEEVIRTAVEKVSEEISKIDDRISEFDEAVQMGELQSRFSDFEFFTLGRRLLCNTDALKFSRKWTNSRHLILFSDLLLVAEPGLLPQSLKVNKIYKSGEYLIVPVNDNSPFENAVDVKQKKKSFRCNLPDLKTKNAFLEAFNRMLEMNKIDIKALEMKGFSPVWIPDDQAPLCMHCKSKFTFINRRHHCRFCGDCICRNCFNNKIKLPGISEKPMRVCPKCYTHIRELLAESGENVHGNESETSERSRKYEDNLSDSSDQIYV